MNKAFKGIDEFEKEYVGIRKSGKSKDQRCRENRDYMTDLAIGFLHADGSLR